VNETRRRAIARFRDEVYAKADTIDPNQNHDWHDLALGFMLACGVPREELSWGFLSDLSCGHFAKYLDPALDWAHAYLKANPEYVTVRLGHGFDPTVGFPGRHVVWADPIDGDGRHLAASQDTPLPALPDDVTQWVTDNVPLGEYVDHGRPRDP
jgi:hypothetical protein